MIFSCLRIFGIVILINFCGAHAAEKNGAEPDLYIKLPTFLVPVIQNRKIKAAYSISLMLELSDKEYRQDVSLLNPRIIDSILIDLYGLFGVIWDPYIHINLEELKARLLKIVHKVSGPHRIKSVLIQEFHSQIKDNQT
jgi:hypothetical protein